MKNFFAIFTKAWFWWLIGLIAAVLLVWFIFPLVKFGDYAPLASAAVRLSVILLLVITWSIINIVLLKKQKKEENTEDKEADPLAVQQSLGLLKQNFKKALNMATQGNNWWNRLVKRSHYNAPWYLLMGASQSGRSSLLKNSQLPYPIANESHQQFEQSKEDYCQWWFSRDAVLIDTQGDFVTQLDEKTLQYKVWIGLLKLLKFYRRSKPVDGVILTLDIHDILKKNEADLTTLAHTFRTQLQTMNKVLGMQALVYVCFTKLDLIAGFEEYVAYLTEQERRKLFGFCFDYQPNKDAIVQFDGQFNLFVEQLESHFFSQLNQTSDPKKAALIINFVAQLKAIRSVLHKFLFNIFESNQFQQRLAVRGVYFTSALQQGVPVNCIANVIAQQYGVSTVAATKKIQTGQKSYFIHDLFTQAIFPEKNILTFNLMQKQRQATALRLTYVAAASVVLLMLYIWGNSYLLNDTQLNIMQNDIVEFEAISANTTSTNSSLLYVLPMLDEIRDMRASFHPEADPASMHFGLYQGNEIDQVAETIYIHNLMIYFMPYVVDLVRKELINPEAKPNQLYNALRVYLMLGNPSKMEPDFVVNWLVTYWEKKYSSQPDTIESLQEHAASLLSKKMKPITIDEQLVANIRGKLASTSQAERNYFELQELAEISQLESLQISTGVDADFNQVFGVSASHLSVPALYTKTGYDTIYKVELEKIVDNSHYANWILGENYQHSLQKQASKAEISSQLETFYMRDYIHYWDELMDGLHIQPFNNLKQATTVLGVLASPNSPILQTLNLINENTILNEAKASEGKKSDLLGNAQQQLKANQTLVNAVQPKALQQATSKAKRFVPKYKKGKKGAAGIASDNVDTEVDKQFAPLNQLLQNGQGSEAAPAIDQVMDSLNKLYKAMSDINNSPNPSEKAYQLVLSSTDAQSNESPLVLLKTQAESLPEPVKGWINSIVQYSWQSILASATDYIDQKYQSQLLSAYQTTVAPYYPFNSASDKPLPMAEFANYFAPQGKIDFFFDTYLKNFVDNTGDTWKLKPVMGQALPINPQIITEFERAAKIRQAFFTEANGAPKLAYSIIITNMSSSLKSAVFILNKTILDYRHGPKREINFTWPADDADNHDRLIITSLTEQQKALEATGLWSPFKLIDQGKVRPAKSGSHDVYVTYSLDGKEVSYLLKTTGTINPFDPKVLRYFQLPKKVGISK